MKKRVKLFTTIASLCLAVALMAFGVYAAANVTYNVNGTVSYVMTDVLVDVTTTLHKSSHVADAMNKVEGQAPAMLDAAGLAALGTYTDEVDLLPDDAQKTAYHFETIDEATGKFDTTLTTEDTYTNTLETLSYDFTQTSVYKLTVTIATENNAGVEVTPTVTHRDGYVEANENYYVRLAVTGATEAAGVYTIAKGTPATFTYYIAIKDVTTQISADKLNFSFSMAQA